MKNILVKTGSAALFILVVVFFSLMPTSASAQTDCELSGSGTLGNGDTFMFINITTNIGGTVRSIPRPRIMHMTGERPPRHLQGIPELGSCRFNGVTSISMSGTGQFRTPGIPSDPACFEIHAEDSRTTTDSYLIRITRADESLPDPCPGGKVLLEISGLLVAGDIVATELR